MSHDPVLDAVALASAFGANRLDPVDAAEDALDQARASGNVFIVLTAERARREAEASARRWRDDAPSGPFDGVPIAWKDLFDLAGTVTTAGAGFRRDAAPATTDAPLVADASRAGLVSIGKTNLTELAFSGLGLNPHYGTPVHPRVQGAVPGGSSSGSAVAVARGVVPLAFGSDTAGSVRVPAAFHDLVGYRPSMHRYALEGVSPLAPSFDTAGPFARSLRDIRVLDAVLTGEVPPGLDRVPASGCAFIVDDALLADPRVTEAVRIAVEDAIARLGRAGATITRRRRTVLSDIGALIERDGWLGGAEAAATHEALLAGPDAERIDPAIRARLALGAAMPAARVVRLYQARETMARRLSVEAGGAAFLMPAVAHPPPMLADVATVEDFTRVNASTLRLSMIASFVGMAAIALPCGGGIGVVVAGCAGHDALLFRQASVVDDALRGQARP